MLHPHSYSRGAQTSDIQSANVAELLMSAKGTFITDADFFIDSRTSYFYGPRKP